MGGHQTEKTGRGTEQQVQSHSLRALVEQMPADRFADSADSCHHICLLSHAPRHPAPECQTSLPRVSESPQSPARPVPWPRFQALPPLHMALILGKWPSHFHAQLPLPHPYRGESQPLSPGVIVPFLVHSRCLPH